MQRGIGDDAAVLRPDAAQDWIFTCDQFIEDVHFVAGIHPAHAVGYKSLARATSDIAAMGGQPELFLLSLAIPASRAGAWLGQMASGMGQAARQFGLRLAGGDTAQCPKIAIGITVLGKVARGCALRRDGARPGEAIFVSGTLGAAELGLQLILRGRYRPQQRSDLLRPQLYPRPALSLGRWLAKNKIASAAMDISDGLSLDLRRLCAASGVGARIYAHRLPCVSLNQTLRSRGWDPEELALHGGEDYGLLFTVPQRRAAKLAPFFAGIKLACIGQTVPGGGVRLIRANGKEEELQPKGWDHFSRADAKAAASNCSRRGFPSAPAAGRRAL